ncbi:MAG: beta-eliminating lyase-related protein [Litorimonas sp.]
MASNSDMTSNEVEPSGIHDVADVDRIGLQHILETENPPPGARKNFLSDSTGRICPSAFEALREVNQSQHLSFGKDPYTQKLEDTFKKHFETDLRVYTVPSGSAANALALASICPPHGAVYCHELAHIQRDEAGAPEFFTGGAKLELVQGMHGKLTPSALLEKLETVFDVYYMVQPFALSLTQATEMGTLYSLNELSELAAVAHGRGMKVHLDGARLANAVVSTNCSLADMTWRAGVDVLSFGSTKNGVLCGDAVVFFDPDLAKDFEIRRKRAAHTVGKRRYMCAQIIAYLESGDWERNAQRANALAAQIAEAASGLLIAPTQVNQVFMAVSDRLEHALQDGGFSYIPFALAGKKMGRFVTSWDQSEEDVETLCEVIKKSKSTG